MKYLGAVLLAFLWGVGCATPEKDLSSRLAPGMTRDEVEEALRVPEIEEGVPLLSNIPAFSMGTFKMFYQSPLYPGMDIYVAYGCDEDEMRLSHWNIGR